MLPARSGTTELFIVGVPRRFQSRSRADDARVLPETSPNQGGRAVAAAQLVRAADLHPREFAGHSLRSGYATQAARDGRDRGDIGHIL